MDYASGAELAAFQWNIMANPAPLTWFDSEEDEKYYVRNYETTGIYSIRVTNLKAVENLTKLSAIPFNIGLPFEILLLIQKARDPSYNVSKGDVGNVMFRAIGFSSFKLIKMAGSIDGLGEIILQTSRQSLSSVLTLLSDPEIGEVIIDTYAIQSLEEKGLGYCTKGFYTEWEPDRGFNFNQEFIANLAAEIMSNTALTSKQDFSLTDEIIKRIEQIMNEEKEIIRELLKNPTIEYEEE